MILDGHTLSIGIGDQTLIYRPMLEFERDQLAELIDSGSETEAEQTWDTFLRQHIVRWTGPLEKVRSLVEGDPKRENADAENLRDGTLLQLTHPHLGIGFDCATCQKYVFDPQKIENPYGIHGPTERTEDMPVQCETTIPCPRGHHTSPKGLSEKNAQAYLHFRRCAAVNTFPDDPIVHNNARIIRDAMYAFKIRNR